MVNLNYIISTAKKGLVNADCGLFDGCLSKLKSKYESCDEERKNNFIKNLELFVTCIENRDLSLKLRECVEKNVRYETLNNPHYDGNKAKEIKKKQD